MARGYFDNREYGDAIPFFQRAVYDVNLEGSRVTCLRWLRSCYKHAGADLSDLREYYAEVMEDLENNGLAFIAETESIWTLRDLGEPERALEEFVARRWNLDNRIDSLRNEKQILLINRHLNRDNRANSIDSERLNTVSFRRDIRNLNELIWQESEYKGNFIPNRIDLIEIYPNPFNGNLHIGYDLTKDFIIDISVFDASGRRVAILDEGMQRMGRRRLSWGAVNIPSGIYYIKFSTPEITETQKVMLAK